MMRRRRKASNDGAGPEVSRVPDLDKPVSDGSEHVEYDVELVEPTAPDRLDRPDRLPTIMSTPPAARPSPRRSSVVVDSDGPDGLDLRPVDRRPIVPP